MQWKFKGEKTDLSSSCDVCSWLICWDAHPPFHKPPKNYTKSSQNSRFSLKTQLFTLSCFLPSTSQTSISPSTGEHGQLANPSLLACVKNGRPGFGRRGEVGKKLWLFKHKKLGRERGTGAGQRQCLWRWYLAEAFEAPGGPGITIHHCPQPSHAGSWPL